MCTRRLPALLAPRDAAGTGRAVLRVPEGASIKSGVATCSVSCPSPVLSRMHVDVPVHAFISVEAFPPRRSTPRFVFTLMQVCFTLETSAMSPGVGIAEPLRQASRGATQLPSWRAVRDWSARALPKGLCSRARDATPGPEWQHRHLIRSGSQPSAFPGRCKPVPLTRDCLVCPGNAASDAQSNAAEVGPASTSLVKHMDGTVANLCIECCPPGCRKTPHR